MYFPIYFKRQKGAVSQDPALGVATDPAPVFGTAALARTDTILNAKIGGVGNQIQRVAVGYWFSGGSGADLTATLWAFDRNSACWYKAATGTLKDGEVTYFRVPYLADPPQTAANMSKPSSGGGEYYLSVADPGVGAGNGVYHFVMGPDTAQF